MGFVVAILSSAVLCGAQIHDSVQYSPTDSCDVRVGIY